MTIVYLPGNACFGVMYGDRLIDIDGQYFFASKKELAEFIRPLGLKVSGNRIVLA
jgi:hypothetical protein